MLDVVKKVFDSKSNSLLFLLLISFTFAVYSDPQTGKQIIEQINETIFYDTMVQGFVFKLVLTFSVIFTSIFSFKILRLEISYNTKQFRDRLNTEKWTMFIWILVGYLLVLQNYTFEIFIKKSFMYFTIGFFIIFAAIPLSKLCKKFNFPFS